LPDQQSSAFVLAHDFRFALPKCTEHAIAQNQCIGVVAAGFFEADRMVQAVGLDRRKKVRIPTGRVDPCVKCAFKLLMSKRCANQGEIRAKDENACI
jgi:hypothetical protein